MNRLTRLTLSIVVSAFGGAAVLPANGTLPSPEEMWALIQQQQQQIETLSRRLDEAETRSAAADRQASLFEEQIEATSTYVETMADSIGPGENAWYRRTSLGGYGELHYNTGDRDEIDFHRFVLFVNHEFSDEIRLFSELEVEHALAGDDAPGEVELEQAFIEFDLSDQSRARAGLFLLPIGILNEIHEPNTFYGVERNRVETSIIPTTWWEGGLGYTRQFENGLSWDLALHSGLNTATANIRAGRQKVAKATAEDGAATTRIKYTGVPGLELAASLQVQQDIAQGALPNESAGATLAEVHADWRRDGFGLRALYARWDISGATAEALGRDVQVGYYLEPSYRFTTTLGDLGFFARYSVVDNSAGDSIDSRQSYTDVGMNYWPHPQVVFKADVQFADLPSSSDETLNLGVGFQF
ncbi:MAG: hypothetical protein R3F07_18030 [Opitutaceae bacterium]